MRCAACTRTLGTVSFVSVMMLMMSTDGIVNGARKEGNKMCEFAQSHSHRINYEILREHHPRVEDAIKWYLEEVQAQEITGVHQIPREILYPIAFYLSYNNGTCGNCGPYNWYRFGEIVHPSLCDYRDRYDHNLEESPRQNLPKGGLTNSSAIVNIQ